MNHKFYAYMWVRKNGTPYYVGKGFGNRAFKSVRGHRPPKDHFRILIFNRASEQDAIATEVELIHNWGRKDIGTGCLHNRTNGGEGKSGYCVSAETKARIAAGNRGKQISTATREKLAMALRGKKASVETRQKLSDIKQGHSVSPECRAKLSAIMKTNEKVRTSRLGHKNTTDHNAKISASKMGHTVSEETRQKIRRALKQRQEKSNV